ncbi:MAG: 6-phosphogluconolactonase [Neisseria sp.]|nr:6-phosphogluconolactonase [Neisseria sp.]
MSFDWTEFADAAAAAEGLAAAVAHNLRDTLAVKERAVLAVSGGRSPIAFFQALNQADLDWSRVDITLADERIVPVSHADSNTALVREYLLQNRAAAANWLPLIDDAADEGRLKNTADAVAFAVQHYRRPDVLVLGMGGDGHTASLFPQAPQFSDGISPDFAAPLLHTTPVTAPRERISMTLNEIIAVPHIYLAIGGAEKKAVFERAAEAQTAELPISFVLHSPKAVCNVYYAN